jgi:hypothetical protein
VTVPEDIQTLRGLILAFEDGWGNKLADHAALDRMVEELHRLQDENERKEIERDFWESRYRVQHGTVHRLEARLQAAEHALRTVISACAPPVEALCAVHADGKYIATSTVNAFLVARHELRAAAAALAAAAQETQS